MYGVYESLRVIIGQVTNRVFVGLPLCRNKTLLDAGVAYAQESPVSAQVLALFPCPLRRLVPPLFTRSRLKCEETWSRVVRRLREWEDHDRHPEGKQMQHPTVS